MKSTLLAFLCALFLLSVVNSKLNGAPDDIDPFFVTGSRYEDHVLRAIYQPDGKVVIVGKFMDIAGVRLGHVARLLPNGNLDKTFDPGLGSNSDINAVGLLSDGRIVVAGTFANFDGTPAPRIAMLNPDGSRDLGFSTGTGPDFTVNDLLVQPDNKIVIVGRFLNVDGNTASRIARLNTDGSYDSSFQIGTGANGDLEVIEQRTNGKLVVGGNFTNFAGNSRNKVVQLNTNGSVDTGFSTGGPVSSVESIAFQSTGKVLIGGEFGIMRLNASGGVDSSFSTSGITSVSGIAVQPDNRIAIGGKFPRPIGLNWTVMRLQANGTEDTSFEKDEFDPVNEVLLDPTGLPVAFGYMNQFDNSIGGTVKTGIKRFNNDGTFDPTYLTRTGAAEFIVQKVKLQQDGKMIIWGDFSDIGGLTRPGFGRIEPDGPVDELFAPTIRPSAMAPQANGTVIVGGVSTKNNRVFNFHRLNADGSIDPSFVAESEDDKVSSEPPNILDMATQADGKVIAVGSFEKINGVARKGVVRLNTDGSIDTTYTQGLNYSNGEVHRIFLRDDGKAFVSGSFGNSHSIFLLNTDGTVDGSFSNSIPNRRYFDIWELEDGKVMVCGLFTQINGFPVNDVARLHSNGAVDTSFNPPDFDSPTSGFVRTVIGTANNKVLIGGDFMQVDGISRRSFARLNSDGSLDTDYDPPSPGGNVSFYDFVKQPDGKTVAVGHFTGVWGRARYYIARLEGEPVANPGSTKFDFDGDSKADVSIFRPGPGEWWYQRSSDSGVTALQFGSSTDIPVPADYTGDGVTDIAFFRPPTGEWFVLRSEDSSFFAFNFGANGDQPAPGDFDGDGIDDPAVFRESIGQWFVLRSSDGTSQVVPFGIAGDKALVGDYDGDGTADVGVFRSSLSQYWLLRSTAGLIAYQFGQTGDQAFAADFTGDGTDDAGFFRPATGEWFILRSEDQSFFAFPFGATGDIPAPADYDGDGTADPTVFRPSTATWFSAQTTSGTVITPFGANGDRPTANSYVVE